MFKKPAPGAHSLQVPMFEHLNHTNNIAMAFAEISTPHQRHEVFKCISERSFFVPSKKSLRPICSLPAAKTFLNMKEVTLRLENV